MSNGTRKRRSELTKPSTWLLNCINHDPIKNVIPVGPRFQVNVPKWEGAINKSRLLLGYKWDDDNSKWLGSRVWPIGSRNMTTTEKEIGEGRPNSCSCALPGSVDCIKHHILERRLLLKRELGGVFFTWKFDEMGERVSKSWSMKDRKTFESIVKMKPTSEGRDFVRRALRHFPNKCRKGIVSYYFNVYVPDRLSLQTRLPSTKQVDTDDEDEVLDCKYLGMKKRSEKGKMLKS
ncbi:AT-rich interactive domain-containing protein 2-like [Andrographis paniculata]|uniref:AT-rich interactive domain-containing protein 2-like n=1 Tax=Andrographis paniculata TaxID=175694 RepID=UPI0021E97F52|nr:AT-rich interactive domain-containing protein 2-like [Andrographis paniculata]XP_051129065.1 AT-rich interactive domain-containing protein 2-like [Andrographis paniculata]